MGSEHRKGEVLPLFETRRAEGRILYRPFAASVFVGIVAIWVYRASHMPGPGEDGRFGWIGLLGAELWFGLYWLLTQALRWNRLHRSTFKDRLSQRYIYICRSVTGGLFLLRFLDAIEDKELGSVKILIDGRDPEAKDIEGCALPTLVYLAREKRPQHHHNFKAGSMNALIRVSSEISNGQVILNVDCDMYSNNSGSVRDALCFFMDEDKGHEIAYVQFPQNFENVTKNDVYGSSFVVINEASSDRNSIYSYGITKASHDEVLVLPVCLELANADWLEIRLSSRRRENGVIDPIRGMEIGILQPNKKGLLRRCSNVARSDASAAQEMVRRRFPNLPVQVQSCVVWSRKDGPGLQMAYCTYLLWAPNCLATVLYSVVPSLYLLRAISLFPQASKYGYSLAEFLWSGGTVLGWWNEQRVWLYKRTTSYLFAFVDTILGLFGFSETSFVVTNKVSTPDVSLRYEKELMEFGTSFPMFTVLATLAMINLISLVWAAKRAVTDAGVRVFETVALQMVLCGVLVAINVPLYSALFFRKDNGKIPSSIAAKSVLLAVFVCNCSMFLL
ncbi:hypothetical protein C3L33_11511, partial [Rhododendron williamsianum]